MKASLTILVIAAALSIGSSQATGTVPAGSPKGAPDLHNSRNSLDWAGTYEGVLPCADCPGIRTRLTLNKNGTYEFRAEFIDRPITPKTVRGKFTWHRNGSAISLDARGGRQQFAVREGHLSPLNLDGTPLNDQDRILKRIS